MWCFNPWVGLHDNIPADVLPRWHKILQYRATQPRCTDVRETTSAVQPTFWGDDSFILSAMVASWHPNRYVQPPWRRIRSGTLSCNPALNPEGHRTASLSYAPHPL